MMKINIAIDGFAGCGKSTLAKQLAESLNYLFIDTGALYRGITLFVLNNSSQEINEIQVSKILKQKPRLEFSENQNQLILNDENVEEIIRSVDVASKVSSIAALPSVRNYLLQIQRNFINQKGVVMEGRDIGTVIMPDAEAKFFITASMEQRVMRRYLQLQDSAKPMTKEQVEENLIARDFSDATRVEAPLKLAPDAIVVDTSQLNVKEQLKTLLALVYPKLDSKLLPFVS